MLSSVDAAELANCTKRLRTFFEFAAPLIGRPTPKVASVVMNKGSFVRAMSALAGPLERARDLGVLADPWLLARLKRREVTNASVLAGLWSPALAGKPASDFLAAFLSRLSRNSSILLPEPAALAEGYVVRTEDSPMGDFADRVDITIEGMTFLIGIEVKIDAGLQPDQIGRYQEVINRRAKNLEKLATVIFLSPRRTSHTGVIQANWNDVAMAARAVALKKGPARTFNHHLIERFAAHVARF